MRGRAGLIQQGGTMTWTSTPHIKLKHSVAQPYQSVEISSQ